MVISPALLRLALCKLASTAEGQANRELYTLLELPSQDATKTCYSILKEMLEILTQSDVIMLNKMYLPYISDIEPTFMANSTYIYGVQVEKIGYNYPKTAVSFINRWIQSATYSRLKDVVNSSDINHNSSIVLVSAAHIKPTWEFTFDIAKSKGMKFRTSNNTVITIPMMQKIHEYFYLEDEDNDMKVLNIKLNSWGMSMYFMVPNNAKGLTKLLDKLSKNPFFMAQTVKKMEWKIVKVILPIFKIKTCVDWTEVLRKIGFTHILSNNTKDLNSIYKKNHNSTLSNMHLTKAKQKVFIEIEEMGAFRQATDAFSMLNDQFGDPSWQTSNIPEFIADRPFYFTLSMRVGDQDYDIFNGVFYKPE